MKDKNGTILKIGDTVKYRPTKYEEYTMKIENIGGVTMLVEYEKQRRVKTLVFNKADLKEIEKVTPWKEKNT